MYKLDTGQILIFFFKALDTKKNSGQMTSKKREKFLPHKMDVNLLKNDF